MQRVRLYIVKNSYESHKQLVNTKECQPCATSRTYAINMTNIQKIQQISYSSSYIDLNLVGFRTLRRSGQIEPIQADPYPKVVDNFLFISPKSVSRYSLVTPRTSKCFFDILFFNVVQMTLSFRRKFQFQSFFFFRRPKLKL